MKKTLGSAVLASLLVFGLTGCGGGDAKPAEESFDERCRIGGKLAPEWACGNANIEGAITAVGIAPISKAGRGFTTREAQAQGRSNLAQQIQSLVKDKVEQFTRSTGVGDDEVVDKVSTQVSKQVAKVTLKGSKQIKSWENANTNELYVLMAVPEKSMNAEAKKQVKSSFKNDQALWQQFQSKNALDSLEKEFPE